MPYAVSLKVDDKKKGLTAGRRTPHVWSDGRRKSKAMGKQREGGPWEKEKEKNNVGPSGPVRRMGDMTVDRVGKKERKDKPQPTHPSAIIIIPEGPSKVTVRPSG